MPDTPPSPKPPLSVLITDLDNTLFDWVAFWHASFKALLDSIVETSGIPSEQLEPEIKAVFQRHGTSEYAFLIQEVPSLQQKYPNTDLSAYFDAAIHAYRSARKRTLKLYPNVLTTLKELKRRGCLVVGYTESMAFYSNYRVRVLGLDGLLDYIYSPQDHDLPEGITPEQLRHYAPEAYQLRHTKHRHTPRGVLKPSPAVLLDILEEIGAQPEATAYVGDNLMKDVAMAQEAGVRDVHAAYGAAQHREEYELLRRVTHWSSAAVEKEKATTVDIVRPTVSIQDFSELLNIFSIQSFVEPRQPNDTNLKEVLDVWKTTIGVQMHFNDLSLRIRNFAITILLAALGAAGVALKDNITANVLGLRVSLGSVLLVAGLIGWLACYFMDRWWYHRLLVGAVKAGVQVEKRLRLALPEAALTDAIGRESPVRWSTPKLWFVKPRAGAIHSTRKIDIFYGVIGILLVLGCLITGALPVSYRDGASAPTAVFTPVPTPGTSPSATPRESATTPSPSSAPSATRSAP